MGKNIIKLIVVFLLCVSIFGVNTTYSVEEHTDSSINTQFARSEPEPFEGKIYQLHRIKEVIDGDTIKIEILDYDWIKEGEERPDDNLISIRLMGVNCFDKWDQTSWLEAKSCTLDFFTHGTEPVFDKDEYIRLHTYEYRMKVIKRDNNSRLLAYIVAHPENTYQEDDFFNDNDGEDLSLMLIRAGLAIPSINFCVSDNDLEYYQRVLKYTEYALSAYKKSDYKDFDSIWCNDKLSNEIDIIIVPSDENDETHLTKGNHISIKWSDNLTRECINLTGYSIVDENALQSHRYFLPDVSLGKHTSEISMWFGTPKVEPDYWIERNEDGTIDLYALIGNLISINPKSKGESIFLRDPNRKIVDWVYWNGEETVTPDKIIEHLESLMKKLIEKEKTTDDTEEG